MKKNIVIIILTVLCITFGVIAFSNKKETALEEEDVPKTTHKELLSMMIEQNAGAGDYSLEKRDSWPTKDEGYVFNSTLSRCDKGSKLSWDDELNLVLMEGTTSDKCYVYFDVYNPPTITEFILAQYTGIQGENGLYNHNETILDTEGNVMNAQDGSYRYAGRSDSVNNFICFGSYEKICPADNLYRIIGVFGDKVKLIKWDYANSDLLGADETYGLKYTYSATDYSKYKGIKSIINRYQWGSDRDWKIADLNLINLNTNYLTNIKIEWANKIAETNWIVGSNDKDDIMNSNAKIAFNSEITTNLEKGLTYNAKIGLMYVSDYYYAASPLYWSYVGNGTGGSYSTATIDNWLHMGLDEWTITVSSFGNIIKADGSVDTSNTRGSEINPHSGSRSIRPVFFLNSDVTYASGIGTKDDSIRIN